MQNAIDYAKEIPDVDGWQLIRLCIQPVQLEFDSRVLARETVAIDVRVGGVFRDFKGLTNGQAGQSTCSDAFVDSDSASTIIAVPKAARAQIQQAKQQAAHLVGMPQEAVTLLLDWQRYGEGLTNDNQRGRGQDQDPNIAVVIEQGFRWTQPLVKILLMDADIRRKVADATNMADSNDVTVVKAVLTTLFDKAKARSV